MYDANKANLAAPDRAPFDVSTLIEGEVQALAAERAGSASRDALRRLADGGNRAAPRPKPADDSTLDASSAAEGAEAAGPDLVNHPPHYTSHPSGVECITITEWMNFNIGNAVKYLWRSGEKGFEIQDLKKARWYVDREIARLEKLRDGQ